MLQTLHNSLYAYENGNWINNGLSGYGCSGRALTRLANNRIIVSKWGYLRDLYISDDNGSNWTNVTNVNNDYRDIIVADNGNVFACGGNGTASMTGLIKSTDNGSSFFNVSSELGINYASTLSDDCEGNLYVLADNSIYKSSDEGESWVLFSNTPFNSTVSYSFLLPISSDVLFLFGRNANEIGLYESNNGGATWHELTNPLSDLNTIREIKLVDNVLVILSDEGVFGKTIEISTSTFLWSTGDTTANISVTPTETTEYWVDVTTNGLTCREYVIIDVTAPAAPTGDSEQTFCEASTVADLTATGDNIQWYDAATGGNLLDSITALNDGQMVYASQTIDGCESTDRLEVTVSIQDIQINASSTEVCAGESVDLSVVGDVNSTYLWSTGESNFSGQGTLIDEYSLIANTVSQNTFSTIPGNIYRLEVSGTINLGGGAGNQRDVAYYIQSGSDGTIEGTPFDSACNLRIWTSLFCDTPGLRPSPDIYDASTHTYNYPFTANSSTLDVGFWDSPLSDNGSNVVTFKLYELSNSESTITVTPTETTEYWVDVTTNGVTCREYVIIDVTAPAAPTGDSEQTFCEVSTVADLTATGDNIQWYDAATGGNLLDSITALNDGQMVYASQTIDGCESTDRLEVTVSIQDIQINASSTEVCAGESVDLSVVGDVNSTYLWSTGESNFSGQGTLIDEYSLIANTVSQNTFSTIPGNTYRLEVSGTINLGGGAGNQRDVAYYIQSGSDGTIEGTPFDSACNLRIWTSLFCDTPGLRPSPDIYDASTHTYNYPFTANSSTLDVGFWDSPLSDNGSNVVTFKLYELSNSESTITVTPTETTEYWVDVTTNGVTCREYVTISVNEFPEQPLSGGDISECETITAQSLTAIASAEVGESITWYDAATGGNLVTDPSLSAAGTVTYFAEATNNTSGCSSLTRTAVTLTIETAPEAPVSGGDISECETITAQSLTAIASAEAGENITWYDAATGGNLVTDPSLSAAGTVTYFAEATNNTSGCSSLTRTAVTLTITSVAAPTGDAVQSFCDNVSVSDLLATGSNIQWYDASTGGNVLDTSSALSDGQLLYASQTQNGCESITRLEVGVEIDIIPDPILITTELEFCLSRETTLADLEVLFDDLFFALEWYDSFSGGNMLPMDTLLEDGVSYYATLYDAVSGCESLMRLEVVPTVIPCEVVIYNAISLNDNGINDYMVIENAEYFPDNILEIYNRDGHLLYSQTQYSIGDNLFRGVANVSGIYASPLSGDGPRLPTGSYLYVFKYFNPYEQQQFTLKGFLTINSN